MRVSARSSLSAALRLLGAGALALGACLGPAVPALATITIKDRNISEPLVLDQPEDYFLEKVYISGISDLAALTLTGKIGSVTLSHCAFTNITAGMNNKAVCAEAAGAMVGSFTALDSAFEDAQNQLVCLREGAFGTVNFTRCRFRTSETFLKRLYGESPWRSTPPVTEFANINRLELIDNEYSNTVLVVHPSVKMVVIRGDVSNVRLQSPNTQVFRLERGQDPSTIGPDGTALAAVPARGVGADCMGSDGMAMGGLGDADPADGLPAEEPAAVALAADGPALPEPPQPADQPEPAPLAVPTVPALDPGLPATSVTEPMPVLPARPTFPVSAPRAADSGR